MKRIKPMLAKLSGLPENDEEYGFEVKWDGMRAILYRQPEGLQLVSRNQNLVTSQYPEIKELERANKQDFILDGEIVCLGPDGKPSFAGLQRRMGVVNPQSVDERRKIYPVTYIIFDLLFFQGEFLLHLPYTQRRKLLENLSLEGPNWQTPPYHLGSGPEVQAAVRRAGLEGIVAKRLESIYQPGQRTGDWLKIKNKQRQEFVIGGWVYGQGTRQAKIGALIIGYFNISPAQAYQSDQPQCLFYAGKAGTGFSAAELEELYSLLKPLAMQDNPFAALPPVKEPVFVQPVLVGEFEFVEWTPNNTLRHPVFLGLRKDKQAKEVIRES